MLILDYIIYVYYRLACTDPFWNAMPYLGSSFYLSIPISLLFNRFLKVCGVEYNTFNILICFFLTWLILYPFVKNSCNRACERIKAKKILSQWWTCMLSFMAFNIIIILLFII
jgi:hypothetical protein